MEWIIVLLLAVSSPTDDNMIYITHANDKPINFATQVDCRVHAAANLGALLEHANVLAPDQQVIKILCVNKDDLNRMKGTRV